MSRVAIIDLGTQSALYLLAESGPGDAIRVVDQEVHSVRLGQGLFDTGEIGEAGLARAAQALADFKVKARDQGADRLEAAGTRVFRWAQNGAASSRRLSRVTGVPLRILSAEEEASLGYLGVVSGPSGMSESQQPLCVIDIGGGSSELSFGQGETLEAGFSLEIGAVGLTEKWAKADSPSWAELRLPGEPEAEWMGRLARACHLVAVAGTATTLAATLLGLERYEVERVEGFEVTLQALREFIEGYQGMDAEARRRLVAIAPERADILLAGCAILHRLLTLSGADRIRVSDWGLRHGLARALFRGQWPPSKA